jgi:hypothetical protein
VGSGGSVSKYCQLREQAGVLWDSIKIDFREVVGLLDRKGFERIGDYLEFDDCSEISVAHTVWQLFSIELWDCLIHLV